MIYEYRNERWLILACTIAILILLIQLIIYQIILTIWFLELIILLIYLILLKEYRNVFFTNFVGWLAFVRDLLILLKILFYF